MQDWGNIYSRELIENPPAEEFLAAYFKYRPPAGAPSAAPSEIDFADFMAAIAPGGGG